MFLRTSPVGFIIAQGRWQNISREGESYQVRFISCSEKYWKVRTNLNTKTGDKTEYFDRLYVFVINYIFQYFYKIISQQTDLHSFD